MTQPQVTDEGRQLIIGQLRDTLKDCKLNDDSDKYLVKWLTLHDFDVKRTEKMMRKSLAWRKKYGADEILLTYTLPETLVNYFSFGHVGVDKFGCPVFVSALGRVDFKGLLQCLTRKEMSRFCAYLYERIFSVIEQECKKRDKNEMKKLTVLIDMEEFSMRQIMYKPAAETLLEIITKFLNFYPDTFRRAFVINAPKIFPIFFGMLKPLLHPTDFPKIKIFASDKEEWSAAVLDEIEADQLPAFYDGTMTDPDGNSKCPSKFNMGGEVPRAYYLTNNMPVAKDYMESMNVFSGASGKKKLKFQVDIPQSVLRWEFLTEGGDIGFRVYYDDSKNTVDLIPLARVDSHLVLEEGQIICKYEGKYVLEFDNSFSYLKGKKVRYHVVVDAPYEFF